VLNGAGGFPDGLGKSDDVLTGSNLWIVGWRLFAGRMVRKISLGGYSRGVPIPIGPHYRLPTDPIPGVCLALK
jgi:hypothetical protein